MDACSGRRSASSESDEVERIVEQKQLTGEQTGRREINSGIYAFRVKPLFANLDKITTDNPHGEYYLTDIAAILAQVRRESRRGASGGCDRSAGREYARTNWRSSMPTCATRKCQRADVGWRQHLQARDLRDRCRRRGRCQTR